MRTLHVNTDAYLNEIQDLAYTGTTSRQIDNMRTKEDAERIVNRLARKIPTVSRTLTDDDGDMTARYMYDCEYSARQSYGGYIVEVALVSERQVGSSMSILKRTI